MNSVQIHLALTHVPVILSLAGLMMLIIAFFIKNSTLTKTSYIIIAVAGLAAIPVYFSGEGAEEAIEKLPGVSGAIIEKHEDIAKLTMVVIAVAGLLAITALLVSGRAVVSRVIKMTVLVASILSGILMVQTAHLGGQIRHSEIRNGYAIQNGNASGSDNEDHGDKHGDD